MKQALLPLFALGLHVALSAQATKVDTPLPLEEFRVPIHGPVDPAEAVEYGLWAAGRNYKASFHDGFVFHPALGSQRAARSMRWSTESIRVGESVVHDALASPMQWHDRWRFEYRHPSFTEAYDVRVDGVEQTFVFHQRPAQEGDLVVRGHFASRLTPDAQPLPAHAALTFRDEDGSAVAQYGAAFVVDANGERLPITTACDGHRIALTVPAAWLRTAAFPITIDPLTSAFAIAYGDTIGLEVAREHESTTSNVMVFYTMRYAQNDWDSFAFLCNEDFSNPWLVYANISTTWNVFAAGLAYAGGSDRWVMPITRQDALRQTPIDLRIEVRQRGDLQLNRGFTVGVPPTSGETFTGGAAIGGSESGTKVLFAYVSKNGNSSAVWTRLLDVTAVTLAAPQRVGPTRVALGTSLGVSKSNTGSDASWLVTYDTTTGVFPYPINIVCVSRIDPTYVGPGNVVEFGSQTNQMSSPLVDGRDGRYLIALSAGGLLTVSAMRIDWPQTSATPTLVGIPRALEGGGLTKPSSVSYDHLGDSHWCVTWQIGGAGSRAARVGYQGGVTELVTLDAGISSPVEWCPPSVAFTQNTREFQIAHVSHATTPPRLQGLRLQYRPDAVVTPYGTACGIAATFVSDAPDAGSQFFTMRAGSLPALAPCVLVLGATQAAIPLGAGCFVNVGGIVGSLPASANARGSANVTFALPDAPLFQGDLYAQWAWSQSGALGTSRGLRVQVR